MTFEIYTKAAGTTMKVFLNPCNGKDELESDPHTVPQGKNKAFLMTTLDGSGWFRDVLVNIDGQEMKRHQLYDMMPTYSYVNNTFMPSEEQELKFGYRKESLVNDNDLTAAKMVKNQWLYPNEETLTEKFAFPIFPFDSQSNILSAIYKAPREPQYLHAGANVVVTLYKRKDLKSFIQHIENKVGDLIKADGRTTQPTGPAISGLTVTLKDLQLNYESVNIDLVPKMAPMVRAPKQKYYVDFPHVEQQLIPTGTMHFNHNFLVPRNARLAIVGFNLQSNIYQDSAKNKPLTPLSFPPKNSKKVLFKLDNNILISDETGFDSSADHAWTCKNNEKLFKHMKDYNIYPRDFFSMFPPKSFSGNFFFVFPLDEYDTSDGATLNCSIEFQPSSEAGWNAYAFTLTQELLSCTKMKEGKYDWEQETIKSK